MTGQSGVAPPTLAQLTDGLDQAEQDGRLGGATRPGEPVLAEWTAAVAAIRDLPLDASVLLACHVNPDGDALGSMLGLGLGLSSLGFRAVQASFPGPMELPDPFTELPGQELLLPAAATEPAPDLMMCFDAASVSRLGELADRVTAAGTTVVLDHHVSYTGFGQIQLVDPQAAATSVLAAELLTRLGVRLDVQIAECLYVALATDTGSFKFATSTPQVHQLAAQLLSTGIRPGEISRRVFDTRPFGAVRLFGDVLRRLRLEPDAAGGLGLTWTWASLDDLLRYDQRPYVLEPLIDSIRCIAEADIACLAKQSAPGEWAVSLRSRGVSDVSAVAVALGGGGHRLAAGFTGYGEVTEVMRQVRAQLDR